MTQGTIVVLNGASSSGKSSIAKELQDILDGYYLHIGIDHFYDLLPKRFYVVSHGDGPATADGVLFVMSEESQRVVELRLGPEYFKVWTGMYLAYAAWASVGNNAIVDDLYIDPRTVRLAADALRSSRACLVGIRCPVDALEQREQARGNRRPGLARVQFGPVHAHGVYDFEVDTSILSPMECALRIKEHLENGPAPTAFAQLRVSQYAADKVAETRRLGTT